MPRHDTAKYKLAHGWLRGEDWWGDPVSNNFVLLDMLAHPNVKSITQTQPPTINTLGDMYIVPTGGEEDFEGHDGEMGILTENGWYFLIPRRGVRVRCESPDAWFWFTGSAGWQLESWSPEPVEPTGSKYDITIPVGFEPLPNDILGPVWIPEPMILHAGAPGSGGRMVEYPPAPAVFSIRRNNAVVGTITFSPSSLSATVNVPSDATFARDDLLFVDVPNDLVEGFRNFGITLRLIRMATGG